VPEQAECLLVGDSALVERRSERVHARREALRALLKACFRHGHTFVHEADVPAPAEYAGRAMRRILLICATAAVLLLPAASAHARGNRAPTGFLVVRNAATDRGVAGSPVVTVVVDGFVLGRISQEGTVEVYHLAATGGSGTAQATGVDLSRRAVVWRGVPGTELSGSGFRFRAVGGVYRIVIHGSGVYVYAGGHGHVTLHGSVAYPNSDGEYALDGHMFRSLPSTTVTRPIGAG